MSGSGSNQAHRCTAHGALTRVMQRLSDQVPQLRSWTLTSEPGGLRVSCEVNDSPMVLLVTERGRGPSYAQTASLAFALVAQDGPIRDLGRLQHRILKLFTALLREQDEGDLRVDPTKSEEIALAEGAASAVGLSGGPPRDEVGGRERSEAAHRRLARDLRWAAYVGYQMLIRDDLYPHNSVLGVALPHDELVEGWQRAADRIRSGSAPRKLGLYVHIPYCARACTYCMCSRTDDFRRGDLARYVEGLRQEADYLAPHLDGLRFTSAYFGGGTPSLLSTQALRELFEMLWQRFDVGRADQVIFEGNPDSLTPEKIAVLGTVGRVTRLTMGVQALDPVVQQRIDRHNKGDRIEALILVGQEHGVLVNCDLMAGLPGQTVASFQRDLELLIEARPDSVHINPYRPMPWTTHAKAEGALTERDIERRREMMVWGQQALGDHQLDSDHITERGLPVNAVNIQEFDLRRQNSSLVGLGIPAYSHSFGSHYYQPRIEDDLQAVLEKPLDAADRRFVGVRADEREEQHKYLVRNFRWGFVRSEFRALFGCDPLEAHGEAFSALEELGLVSVEGDRIRTWPRDMCETLVYRHLLYSEPLARRAREVLGSRYDSGTDYRRAMRDLLGTE